MPEKSALVWHIKSFPGGREFLLRCHFNLPSVEAEEEARGKMPPIKVRACADGTRGGLQLHPAAAPAGTSCAALCWPAPHCPPGASTGLAQVPC